MKTETAAFPPHTILSNLYQQMEAGDADRSRQDICHFVATARLGDEASSPLGMRWGREKMAAYI